jgi:hypothetical protein
MMTIYWKKRKELGRGIDGINTATESGIHLVCIKTMAEGPRVPFVPDALPTVQPVFMSDPVALNKDVFIDISVPYPRQLMRNEMACRGGAQLPASLAFCASDDGRTVLTDNSHQKGISFIRQAQVESFGVLIKSLTCLIT